MRKSQKIRQARRCERPIVGMTKEQRLALIGSSLNNLALTNDNGSYTVVKRNGIKRKRALEMFKDAFLKVVAG